MIHESRAGCAWPGCIRAGNRTHLGRSLCDEHRLEKGRLNRGVGKAAGERHGPVLSSADCADIRRRIARFESPTALASEYGVRSESILAAARRAAP